MFGFLLKIAVVALLVVGIFSVISWRKSGSFRLPDPAQIISLVKMTFNRQAVSKLKEVDTSGVGKSLSGALDSLVTHPGRNSPVVLGVKITNDSLDAIVNVLQNLPPDQYQQLQTLFCAPATSSSR